MNLVLVFCLVAVITNAVTMSSARQLSKNPSDHEKGVDNAAVGAAAAAAAEDPSKNKELDKNQLPYGFPLPVPLPFPFPRFFPGFPLPLPIPIPGRMAPDMLNIPPEYNFLGGGAPSPDRRLPAPPPK
ncbi:U1 small nuclear ribonucleoprotein C-like [Lotus japonicus]|uniref:U1 small nuclear ribonucleoprotein C-like n=1 Tax=Lotus japonicus TaxID=34305 RepID=UPI0025892132|nr:U1 small nuclear ribonucleoprotein C-like [Lotus japonicus]